MRLYSVEAGEGPAVVLLHGFPLDHSMWIGQRGALATHYRLITPDLRGHGRSGNVDEPAKMEAMAGDVLELLDQSGLTEPVVLGGLSMGGYVALAAIHLAPSRFRGLILMDTRSAADTPEAAANREVLAKKVEEAGNAGPAVEAMLPKLFAESTRQTRPDLIEATRAVMMGTSVGGITGALRGMAIRTDRSEELAGWARPTLILVGESDVITTPAEMERISRTIPGALYRVIPNAGHMAPLENPDATNRVLLEFLNGLA